MKSANIPPVLMYEKIKPINTDIKRAAEAIRHSERCAVFTGAGISVESGIAPFRGKGGLWNKYDPAYFEINYFLSNPEKSWEIIKKLFFELIERVKPNKAHFCIADLEKNGYIKTVITQNVDNFHTEAGNTNVFEFHGNLKHLICLDCKSKYHVKEISLEKSLPQCQKCRGILKPDFVFFGEPIPEPARTRAFMEAYIADVFLVVGTTGEVLPACQIPHLAKKNGATIIEVNIDKSSFTDTITDFFLEGKATEILTELVEELR
jgi:NAD-dependent deacetylase